jgi:hypothetical protein
MQMPEGRPESKQHAKSYIVVGLAQGFLLTMSIFLLIGFGI